MTRWARVEFRTREVVLGAEAIPSFQGEDDPWAMMMSF
jgi:hypothetical protein